MIKPMERHIGIRPGAPANPHRAAQILADAEACRRTGKQILPPSGETAAAPVTAPSLGLQISLALTPESRHTPSAPPRDPR